ncbi:hypothetical protein D3C76_1182990 [compost metagenome]
MVQGALLAVRHQELDRTLGAHLVEILGDARQRLCSHHPGDGQPSRRNSQHQQGDDLQAEADVHGAVQPQASAQVTTHQVGNDAEDFVEQK